MKKIICLFLFSFLVFGFKSNSYATPVEIESFTEDTVKKIVDKIKEEETTTQANYISYTKSLVQEGATTLDGKAVEVAEDFLQVLGQIITNRAEKVAYDVLRHQLKNSLKCEKEYSPFFIDEGKGTGKTCKLIDRIRIKDLTREPKPILEASLSDILNYTYYEYIIDSQVGISRDMFISTFTEIVSSGVSSVKDFEPLLKESLFSLISDLKNKDNLSDYMKFVIQVAENTGFLIIDTTTTPDTYKIDVSKLNGVKEEISNVTSELSSILGAVKTINLDNCLPAGSGKECTNSEYVDDINGQIKTILSSNDFLKHDGPYPEIQNVVNKLIKKYYKESEEGQIIMKVKINDDWLNDASIKLKKDLVPLFRDAQKLLVLFDNIKNDNLSPEKRAESVIRFFFTKIRLNINRDVDKKYIKLYNGLEEVIIAVLEKDWSQASYGSLEMLEAHYEIKGKKDKLTGKAFYRAMPSFLEYAQTYEEKPANADEANELKEKRIEIVDGLLTDLNSRTHREGNIFSFGGSLGYTLGENFKDKKDVTGDNNEGYNGYSLPIGIGWQYYNNRLIKYKIIPNHIQLNFFDLGRYVVEGDESYEVDRPNFEEVVSPSITIGWWGLNKEFPVFAGFNGGYSKYLKGLDDSHYNGWYAGFTIGIYVPLLPLN